MRAPEAERLHREILTDLASLLREELVAHAWGRVLVEVVHTASGEAVVAGIDVEEIGGDEALVDAAFGPAAKPLLPVLAKATEALCELEGVELNDVGGGTFVRLEEGFGWLPGLVHAPSPRFDRERDVLVARMQEKNARLRARWTADRVELDVETMMFRWVIGARAVADARATLLGTFAEASRTWAWASSNPSLAEPVRTACAAITDALEERDLWEISTPTFATDESTAWALAALLCDRTNADGVHRIARDDGALFVLLREAQGE
ncbi:MAG: hypothetical protein M3O46_06345 [Myxococcota bacterium]|nr:hypothetical protein [Myxococcota bacterium]